MLRVPRSEVCKTKNSCNREAISKGRYDSLKTLVARCFATLDLKSHWEHWEYWDWEPVA